MRRIRIAAKWLVAFLAAAIVAAGAWLAVAPPDLIRVASAYSAKIVCSNVFVAGRDPQAVLADDVQAPGHPILKLMRVSVDRQRQTVDAGLFGLFGRGLALARPGLGCTNLPEGMPPGPISPLPSAAAPPPAAADELWPQGERVQPSINAAFAKLLDDASLTGPGMRAVVIVHNGRIIGERYGEGFSADTPLLGWSMTKTVNAALLGTAVKAGRLDLGKRDLFAGWAGGERAAISVADLMAMSSGLAFNEEYGDVSDVTRMLFLEPDMSRFAAAAPLSKPVGTTFNYSSGTGVMLSRVWQDAAGEAQAAIDWPRKHLFDPLGMRSAVLETDAAGTFVGSSYLYAGAHDWARFGLLLEQGGAWNGEALLPAGFVDWMRQPAPASNGAYGRGQVWLQGPADAAGSTALDGQLDLPRDIFWAIGHDGQTLAIVPSKRLVVLRMGLTPAKLGYRPQRLVAEAVKALELVSE